MGSIFLETENLGFGNDSFADLDKYHFSSEGGDTTKNISFKNEEKLYTEKKISHKKNINSVKKTEKDKNFSLPDSLKNLISSMKPSFLTRTWTDDSIRQIFLTAGKSPLLLLRKGEDSVLIGTGFSDFTHAWKNFSAFADMRLPFSEKNRLRAWILTDENIDFERFFLILEVLDFPEIFASRTIIAKIRENIPADFYDKVQLSEIFARSFEEKIASLAFLSFSRGEQKILWFSLGDECFAYEIFPLSDIFHATKEGFSMISYDNLWNNFSLSHNEKIDFSIGEIIEFSKEKIEKQNMKFTFDTFFIDEKTVGNVSGYVLSDRKNLAENGVLVFTLEEDEQLRTISGHIFIDSRGFVQGFEMLQIHKEIIKSIRVIYERTVVENPLIERAELVKIFRKNVAEAAFVLTGRLPVVMPIIISKKHF